MLLFVLSGFGVKKVAENPDLPKWNGYANTTDRWLVEKPDLKEGLGLGWG